MTKPILYTDSKLLRISKYGGLRVGPGASTDLCSIFWAVVRATVRFALHCFIYGLVRVIVVLAAVVILWVMVVAPLASLYRLLVWPEGPYTVDGAEIGYIVWGLIAVVTVVLTPVMVLRRFFGARLEARQPSFLTLAYRGWKDKTCIMVDIKQRSET